ncbi:MAG TPA: VOC family protein [Thermoanaerobaculia bacterium]|nr:VOC family protein [Thermoanaerobaculia bacterium]
MFLALRRIHVSASDFQRSRRFYGETLGLPEGGGFENDWVEFALGPLLLKLTPLRPGEVPSRNQVAAVFSTWSLDETIGKLKERGVTVTRPPTDEFTGRSAEILDPDGYRIIVFQASDLHPDEDWVPTSQVDELVKQKLHARKRREQARTLGGARKKARRPAPKKAAQKKKARPAKKKVAKKTARRAAKRPAAKRPAAKRKPAGKRARKKAGRRRR